MIPYIFFILIIGYLYYKKSPLGMLIVMILFAVLRYDTGWDYMMYTETVNTPSWWNNANTSRFSLAWRELFKLAHDLKAPHLAIVLPNVVTYIILYLSLDMLKLSRIQKCQALLVYITWHSFYIDSFSIIRQALSLSLGVMAFALIQRRKFIVAAMVILAAYHLHSSAAVLILLYPVYYFRNRLNFRTICLAGAVIVLGLMSAAKILDSLSMVDMTKFDVYLKASDKFGGTIIYLYLLLAIYLLFTYQLRDKWTEIERQCYFLSIVSMAGCVSVFTLGVSSVFTRIFSYFIIYMIFVVFPSLTSFKDYKKFTPFVTVLLCAYFMAYLQITAGGTKLASSGLIPYKFILID